MASPCCLSVMGAFSGNLPLVNGSCRRRAETARRKRKSRLNKVGWTCVPLMGIGTGCEVRVALPRAWRGMRSRASGVARLQAVPALYACSAFFVRLFTFYERATPEARERIPTALYVGNYRAARAGARPY